MHDDDALKAMLWGAVCERSADSRQDGVWTSGNAHQNTRAVILCDNIRQESTVESLALRDIDRGVQRIQDNDDALEVAREDGGKWCVDIVCSSER
jgi:hypothetical protein